MQLDAVRAGAYRVSRIPKEYVTSREDLSSQLRRICGRRGSDLYKDNLAPPGRVPSEKFFEGTELRVFEQSCAKSSTANVHIPLEGHL